MSSLYRIVHFDQTIPAENGMVCPGGKLQYMCSAVYELSWQIASFIPVTFTESMEVNSTKTLNNFSLVLTANNTTNTGIKIFTTATNDMVTSNLDDQQVACYSAASLSMLYIDIEGRVGLEYLTGFSTFFYSLTLPLVVVKTKHCVYVNLYL